MLFSCSNSSRALTYNAHQVCSHMVSQALLAGPLHCQSASLFETIRGSLRSSIHGSRLADVELVNLVENRISSTQALSKVSTEHHPTNENARHVGNVTLLHTKTNHDLRSWQRVIFDNGLIVDVFDRMSIQKRTISCFIAVSASNCDFTFGRVERMELDDDVPFVTLTVLRVRDALRDPLFSLSGVSPQSADRGCRFTHIRRLDCDPFGDLSDFLRLPISAIVGCCAISDDYIALLPHPQLSYS